MTRPHGIGTPVRFHRFAGEPSGYAGLIVRMGSIPGAVDLVAYIPRHRDWAAFEDVPHGQPRDGVGACWVFPDEAVPA